MTKNVLYIYGWGSNAESPSGKHLQEHLPSDYVVHTFTYDQTDGEKALQQIRAYVQQHHIDLIVGSSLGGFLALLVRNVPRVLVNPCLSPSAELPLIGVDPAIAQTYLPLEPLVANHDLEDNTLVFALFADEDELLGRRYVPLYDRYYGHRRDFHGAHRLNSQIVRDTVVPFILGEVTTALRQYDDFMYNADNLDIYDD